MHVLKWLLHLHMKHELEIVLPSEMMVVLCNALLICKI
jgi:hypothetical protein